MGYILVIYDNKRDLEKIRLLFTVFGYNIKAFSSWEEARCLFDEDLSCDLAITKVKMREANGNDIAYYIKNSQKAKIPILAIGNAEDNIFRDLFTSVLIKPFKLKVLRENVASFLPPPISSVR